MRKPSVFWHKSNQCWASQSGPYGKSGRRKPVYFREIPNTPKGKRQAADALEAYLATRDRAEASATIDRANPSVKVVVEAYLAHAAALVARGELEARTQVTHAERLGKWLDFSPTGKPEDRYAKRRALEIRAEHALSFKRGLKQRGCSPRYVNGLMASVKACWAWAARVEPERVPHQILPADPLAAVAAEKAGRSPEKYATRGELAVLLRFAWRKGNAWKVHTKGRCAACMRAGRPGPCRRGHNPTNELERATVLLVRLAYHAGCRPGELCRATWSDFHPGRGMIELAKHKTSAKVDRPRKILLPPGLVRALQRWKGREAADETIIFPHRLGKDGSRQWNSTTLAAKLRKEWRDPAIEAKLPVRGDLTLYSLRHAFVSDGLAAGLTNAQAGAAVGTSERMVEMVYQHAQEAALHEAAAAVRRGRRG